jgi:polyferredoxin
LDTERLTTLDEYGNRRFVIPAEVTGPYRAWRTRVSAVLILFFLVLPWITMNGLPLLLLDISGRRFALFGKVFLAHDAPLLFLIVAAAALLLGAATAVWGRVWCGWACPQTVFIDGVYRRIEIWIEGDYIKRRQLRLKGMTLERLAKGGLKWALYLAVSYGLATTFLNLFGGAPLWISLPFTALLTFNFGWFREQFCTIVCPYGRFQSVLMDGNSLTVTYNEKRGDCVSCNRCVEVCPAKIDIRKGLQLECIGCTACIDACNVIMKKVGKPPGLIEYQSQNGQGLKLLNPRAIAYTALAVLSLSTFAAKLIQHSPFDAVLLRAKDAPFQTLQDGRIVNHFKLHIFNQTAAPQIFTVQLPEEFAGQGVSLTQAQDKLLIPSGRNMEAHLFVTFPRAAFDQEGRAQISVHVSSPEGEITRDAAALGPVPQQ